MSNTLISVGQITINYLVDGSSTGTLGMFELTVPPGSNVPPPHSHINNDEYIYALEGALRYSVDGQVRDLKPGDCMFSPKGSVHHFSNPYGQTARVLVINTPDIGAQYFRDVAAVINAGGPPDKARLIGVMTRYGLVPASPPGSGGSPTRLGS
jgi:quercetin dioxygenase-like cupin family protein